MSPAFEQWLAEIFSCPDGRTALGIAGETAVIYVLVVVGMRLLGTRELGRLNVYDFVLVVVVANAAQNALVGGDNTLGGGLVSALTLLLMNWLVTWLLDRFPWLERHVVGEPVVLVSDGQAQGERMRREGVTCDELMAALREHGVTTLGEVRLAVLEVDGDISVVPRDSAVHRSRRRFRRVKTS
jgi:uncharacterized membrane protein YcaP (DUF421 family)